MRVFLDSNILIYLNVRLPDDEAMLVEELWLELLHEHNLYTNTLVLDEAIYVSMRKYSVKPADTIEFIDKVILPYTDLLPLGLEEYLEAKKLIKQYNLKPSDALHAATILTNKLDAIVSEDKEFERIGLKRIWIKR